MYLGDFYYKGCRCILSPYYMGGFTIKIGVLHTSTFFNFFRNSQKDKYLNLFEKISNASLSDVTTGAIPEDNYRRYWIGLNFDDTNCSLDVVEFSKKCMNIIDKFPDSNNLKIISTSINDGLNFYEAVEDFTVGRILKNEEE